MTRGYLIDHPPTSATDAEKQLARHLATARRQMQARDEMGRVTAVLPSPLAAWEEPKRQPGQSARHGGGRFRFFGLRLPVRAWVALKMLAERRGVTMTYLILEGIAHVLAPALTEPPRGLADRPVAVAPPQRLHRHSSPARSAGRLPVGYLIDHR